MFKSGPLFDVALEFFGKPINVAGYRSFSPQQGFPDAARLRLRQFLHGARVQVDVDVDGKPIGPAKGVTGISRLSAADLRFTMRDGSKDVQSSVFHSTE